MKILFTGGGSGGHFYPIIAVADAVQKHAREERLLEPELLFAAPDPYDRQELLEHNIAFVPIAAGKIRTYRSLLNIVDLIKTGWGIVKALWRILFIFPDVVFGKGGYGSFPTLVAARVLGIPVIIHDSDTVPGRVNLWAAKFARRIAISFPEAKEHFNKAVPEKKRKETIALTGVPVRKELLTIAPEGGREFLKLDLPLPTILILGGSQGAQSLNETVVEALPRLLENYYVIHQTGKENFEETQATAKLIIEGQNTASRYKVFPYLDLLAMRMAAGAADIVVTRAGATTLFEIASWGKPSLVIPIPQEISRDQHTNAFAYARSGAAEVIEQPNLSPNLLVSEIGRLVQDEEKRKKMAKQAKAFATPDAADKIAREILDLALEHES